MILNLKEKIWVEKYRPQVIEDCILPEAVKKNLENFVVAGNCPNLMFTSLTGGSGKCLDPSEEIEILVSDELYEKFTSVKGKNELNEVIVTLDELFNVFSMKEVPFDELKSLEETIYIKTPENDWVPILGLIKKQDEKLKLSFESGLTSFICGKKHIILSSKGLVFAKDAEDVFNVYLGTFSKIVSKEDVGFGDVYDISIENPHLYVTPNGFVHHNTTVIKALCNQLDLEYLFINSSEQRSIEVLRQDVTSFVTTLSLEGRSKAVIFDECLEENEEIKLSNNMSLKLKDFKLNEQYPILSLNLQTNDIEEDSGEIVSEKIEEVFEIELEDGRKIIVTEEHPFFCKDINGNVFEKSLKDNLSCEDFVLTL